MRQAEWRVEGGMHCENETLAAHTLTVPIIAMLRWPRPAGPPAPERSHICVRTVTYTREGRCLPAMIQAPGYFRKCTLNLDREFNGGFLSCRL